MHRLLQSVAAGDQANEVDRMRQEMLRVKFDEQARRTHRTAAAARPRTRSGPRLGYRVGDRSSNLTTTLLPGATNSPSPQPICIRYGAARQRPNTATLKSSFDAPTSQRVCAKLLLTAVRRFNGDGGDPVIKFRPTSEGANSRANRAYSTSRPVDLRTELPGLEQLLADAKPHCQLARSGASVLVGQQLQPSSVA